MFPTKMQQSDSKQHFASHLSSVNYQSCAVDVVVYRFGLLIAALMTRQKNWPNVQWNVRCVVSYLDPF